MAESFETLTTRRLDFQSERLNKVERAMDAVEKVARRIEEVGARTDKNYHYLFGNGVPGLDERVRNLEARVEQMNAIVKDWAKAVKWAAMVVGGYLVLEIAKFLLANI